MQSPSAKDREVIRQAYDFAETAHGSELRKSGEPYIIHPRAIALTLARLGMDRDTIVAGILHDTIEDTPVTADELEEKFGHTVRFLAESVTKLSKLKYRGLERHVESLRRLLVATASDIRVIIIKFADRLHNMQTIDFVEPVEKRLRIASETMHVYVPIAERLGIGVIKAQLEDLAMKTLEPEKYHEMAAFLAERAEKAKPALEDAKKELRKALASAGMRKFRIESRVKNTHSFTKKLARKENDPDKVYDILAIRIIVPTVEDCYRAMGVVHALWRPLIGRVKDYIADPKPNGYRSLHTTVITRKKITVEMQIRSEEMQQEAQFGVASHFNYKKSAVSLPTVDWIKSLLPSLTKSVVKPVNGNPHPIPRWLRDLTEIEGEHLEHKEFQETLQRDFFAERIFIFTPKGDAIDLPVGATPVDFAYEVHTDLVEKMAGAKVNGKMVQLDTPLHNGNVVEIVTKKSAKPNRKWLEYAKTTRAKRHIRGVLKKLEESRG